MKPLNRIGLLALVTMGSSASAPQSASACSCVTWTTHQVLELVNVEALDGGDTRTEVAFWPQDAELVRYGLDASFKAQDLEIILNQEEP